MVDCATEPAWGWTAVDCYAAAEAIKRGCGKLNINATAGLSGVAM
ncbi:unnamed protein product [Callosobruchus maculatus]|uniref:Uncharacterized protein n=1 Tax=Callosobruchus maculatus TaxID=64391 RepID=A0A653BMY2_CALMS|nr:unnamed protein product [Callosobruchus maculatus]